MNAELRAVPFFSL